MLMKLTTGTIHIDNSYGYANGTKDFEVRIKMHICRFYLKQGPQIYSPQMSYVQIKKNLFFMEILTIFTFYQILWFLNQIFFPNFFNKAH